MSESSEDSEVELFDVGGNVAEFAVLFLSRSEEPKLVILILTASMLLLNKLVTTTN